jgi:hypoxanthine phosphoribosyltransferase
VTASPARLPEAEVVLSEAQIRERVRALGEEIARDHPDGVVLVGVLKGGLVFLADLARAVRGVDVLVDFIAISRYAPDSGRVRITHDLALDLTGRAVVLVEDIVDTGLTVAFLVEHVRARGPRSIEVCTLLDRSARRIVPLAARYVGTELPDRFVLGYGLHLDDLYRNLPCVLAVDRDVLHADPEAYVEALYGARARRRPRGPVLPWPPDHTEGAP